MGAGLTLDTMTRCPVLGRLGQEDQWEVRAVPWPNYNNTTGECWWTIRVRRQPYTQRGDGSFWYMWNGYRLAHSSTEPVMAEILRSAVTKLLLEKLPNPILR